MDIFDTLDLHHAEHTQRLRQLELRAEARVHRPRFAVRLSRAASRTRGARR